MFRRQKVAQFLCFLQVLALVLSSTLAAAKTRDEMAAEVFGTESGGGGGGFVHDQFIFAGLHILVYLKEYPRGQEVSRKLNLNLCRLRNTLREQLVFVNKDGEGLRDQRNSLVNGFAYPWEINLGFGEWTTRLEKNDNVYHLVFKEMLRSEQSRFKTALIDSHELDAFPEELYLGKSVNIDSVKELDNSCLSESDFSVMKKVIRDHEFYLKRNLPGCEKSDIGNDDKSIDRLLYLVRTGKCTVVAKKCSIQAEEADTSDIKFSVKSLFWDNQRLLHVAYSALDKKTGLRTNFASSYVDVALNQHMAELEQEKICLKDKDEKIFEKEIPTRSKIQTNYQVLGSFGQLLETSFANSFEALRKTPTAIIFTHLLGMGSEVELIEPELKTVSFGAKMLKVRVISNTITKIDAATGTLFFNNGLEPFTPARLWNVEIAQPGHEGYVLLGLTKWLHYLHPVTGQLLSK